MSVKEKGDRTCEGAQGPGASPAPCRGLRPTWVCSGCPQRTPLVCRWFWGQRSGGGQNQARHVPTPHTQSRTTAGNSGNHATSVLLEDSTVAVTTAAEPRCSLAVVTWQEGARPVSQARSHPHFIIFLLPVFGLTNPTKNYSYRRKDYHHPQ